MFKSILTSRVFWLFGGEMLGLHFVFQWDLCIMHGVHVGLILASSFISAFSFLVASIG